jgi:ribosomal protein L40E
MADDKRCDYYFEFKPCPSCGVKNDIAARICRTCKGEIIDPNAKLSLKLTQEKPIPVKVLEAKYIVSGTARGFVVSCWYKCEDENGHFGSVSESYSPISDRSMRMFYGQFVKQHCKQSSKWYMHLHNKEKVEEMLQSVQTPHTLLLGRYTDGLRIKKKVF